MTPDLLQQIRKPTLLLDEEKARKNLKCMAEKTAAQGIRFRPHFKTHQSAQIGEWFREAGVAAITVSSLSMASYFADHGWRDILVAFPVNLREIETMRALSARVRLGLLVESMESVTALGENLALPVDIWIKIDTGLHRAGLDVSDVEAMLAVVAEMRRYPGLNLRGLLTHAGQTYHARSSAEIREWYAHSWQALTKLRGEIASGGNPPLEISVGDTPGCWLSDDLGRVDEIRPGNFIFFDSMMLDLGVCAWEEIAVAVACPLVALHARRNEAVIYGGAVHFSKEALQQEGQASYGYAAFFTENGWQFAGRENRLISLSQEHGVLRLNPADFRCLKVGDLIGILPVHSCLTVDALENYLSLDGQKISTLLSG
jgi:Predicted amino acid aldolase or racemase